MQIEKLKEILANNGEPKFRLSQIQKAIYQDGVSAFLEISTISKHLRKLLEKEMKFLSFKVEKILVSKNQNSIKVLLKLSDGNKIETVLLSPMKNKWSVCVSSQVGCALNCVFCATGKGGFQRNLTTEEIADQVLFWKQFIKKNKIKGKISNVVYMGMGEPFLNWKEVKKSLQNLIELNLFGFGARSISVSTAGIPEGILNLAKNFPQVNLAISLHFVRNDLRSRFMPINKIYDLQLLSKSLEEYFKKCNRKVFLEYILIKNINDKISDAEELASFVASFSKKNLLHINLIRGNFTEGKLKPSPFFQIEEFRKYLERKGVSVTVRKSVGEDIQGACGQLAGKVSF